MLARAVLCGLAVLAPAQVLASHLGTIVPIDFGGDGDTDYAIFRGSEGR